MRAIVNKIIPFSSVDGPGNRTSIFLQGCNIDCKYCHNPETRGVCVHCKKCVPGCPTGALTVSETGKVEYNLTACIHCDQCIHICPFDSSPKVMNLTPEQTYDYVKKQIPFIRGITVSGGECMLSPEYMTELFMLAKQDKLSTMIDSNGTVSFADYPKLLDVTDGVMLDIKAYFSEDHIRVTGFDNATVLKNASFLAANRKLFEVRCVIVPDLYDAKKNIEAMSKFLSPLLQFHKFRIKLIAYRPMGVREEYKHYQTPSKTTLEELGDILRQDGFEDIVLI